MPKLTDLVAEQATTAGGRGKCPRCDTRQPSVYVQVRVLKRHWRPADEGAGRANSAGTTKTVKSLNGQLYCRRCAEEVLDQIAQLLGVEQ